MSSDPQDLLEGGERGVDLGVVGDVERHDELRAQRLGERLHAILELLVDVGERELGAFAMHGLRDAPGDGTIGCDADDERALTAQETHVNPLWQLNEAGILPASPVSRGRNQRRRTLTVSFWPGRSIECLLMPFQLTRSDTVTPNTLRDARQRVAAAHLVADRARAARRRPTSCPTRRARVQHQLLAGAQRVAGRPCHSCARASRRPCDGAWRCATANRRCAPRARRDGGRSGRRGHRRAPRPASPSAGRLTTAVGTRSSAADHQRASLPRLFMSRTTIGLRLVLLGDRRDRLARSSPCAAKRARVHRGSAARGCVLKASAVSRGSSRKCGPAGSVAQRWKPGLSS